MMVVVVATTDTCLVQWSGTVLAAIIASVTKVTMYATAVHTLKRGEGSTEASGFTVFSLDVWCSGLNLS
jgi:hypothetical protein